jgi:hypothetical protein
MKLNEMLLPMSLVEGEEEDAFLKTAIADMQKARQRILQKNNHKGRKGGRFDRKRKNEDRDNDNSTAKHAKTDNEPVVAAAE